MPRSTHKCLNITMLVYIYRDSRLNRSESVSLASLARQLFSNQEIIDFCQCAEITHCLTAKYPIAVSKKSYRGLLRVNQKRNY